MLHENITRKFVDSIDINDYEIMTDTGWKNVSSIHKTIPYQIYILELKNGMILECADTHIVFNERLEEVFVKDLTPNDYVMTEGGATKVKSVTKTDQWENMFDITVDDENHRFYSNGILSHNTTTCVAYMLWLTQFHNDKKVAVLANKAELARKILMEYQTAYEDLPAWLKQGVKVWNKGSIILDNGSSVTASATSSNAVRGNSYNCILLDEFAFVSNNIADEFMASVLPTISSSEKAQIIIISTPKGMNHFYKIWDGAKNRTNNYKPFEIHWSEVPGRDEAWAREQLKLLGQVKYEQEVECRFLGSSNTLIDGRTLQNMQYQEPVERMKLFKNHVLDVYEFPQKNLGGKLDIASGRAVTAGNYIVCVDVAEGLGMDYSVISVIDVTTIPYKFVAKYRSNTIQPIVLPTVIVQIAKFYNNAWVLIEINQQPHVAEIVDREFHYERLLKVTATGNGLNQYLMTGGVGSTKRVNLGLKTSNTTKRMGCNALKDLIETGKFLHFDFELYQEFTTFIRIKNSFGADDGYHDDIVMTLVMFGWLTTQEHFKDITHHDLRKQLQKDQLGYIEQGQGTIEEIERKIPQKYMDNTWVADNTIWFSSNEFTDLNNAYSGFLDEFL